MCQSIRRIWPYIRPDRAKLILIVIFGLLMSVATSMIVLLTKLLFDDVFQKHDVEVARWIPFAFPALYFALGTSRYIHLSRLIFLTELVVARVRRDLVDHFVRLNLTFHNSFQSGSGGLISCVLNDTVLLQ